MQSSRGGVFEVLSAVVRGHEHVLEPCAITSLAGFLYVFKLQFGLQLFFVAMTVLQAIIVQGEVRKKREFSWF